MSLDKDGQWLAPEDFRVLPHNVLHDGHGHTIVDSRGGSNGGLHVIHAVLLCTGKVLCFSGHAEFAFYAPMSYLFDPKRPTAPLKRVPFPGGMDLFCCHYVQSPDGRIVVVGGSDKDFAHHGSRGAKNICIFYPDLEEWRLSRKDGKRNELIRARWYPTPVLLADGRVMVVSGRREHDAPLFIAEEVEILTQGTRSTRDWSSTELVGARKFLPTYPGLHLAPNGHVFFTHTNWGWDIDPPTKTTSIEVTDGATSATWQTQTTGPAQILREEATSVLLPPAQDGKILVIGGALALKRDPNNPNDFIPAVRGANPMGRPPFDLIDTGSTPKDAEILETKKSPPTWSKAPGSPMSRGRTNAHCVLLPDETVLIAGGHDGYKWQQKPATTPSLEAEIFTPTGPNVGFREVAAMSSNRMYHSVAMLLPDGTVLVAGGADPNSSEPPLSYPNGWAGPRYGDLLDPNPDFRVTLPFNRKTFEIYKPPYCFKPNEAARPKLTDVRRGGSSTRRVKYGQQFTVVTSQASSIKKVSFMRPGAPTHHTDTEQRYVKLDFTPVNNNSLIVTTVSDRKVAPPGFYMLWIVDNQDRPCQEAKFIHLVVN